MAPKVKIKSQGLAGNTYGNGKKRWGVSTLITFCKAKKYKTFKFPLAAFSLSTEWELGTVNELLFHTKRINNADLKYPIILDNEGDIADGYHRCMKAILLGKTEIDAIRMEEMPPPDGYEKD